MTLLLSPMRLGSLLARVAASRRDLATSVNSDASSDGASTNGRNPATSVKLPEETEMVKTTTKPAPQPETEQGSEGTTGSYIPRRTEAAKNILDMQAAGMTPKAQRKSALLGSVRQHLAELADYDGEAIEADSKRQEMAQGTAFELYQARVDGLITADELSALLGDYFGFKTKKDGSPSKTPDGYGNVLRQRIVRPVAMAEFLDGVSDGGAFFRSLPDEARDDIESVRNRLDNGQIGLWTAYKELGDIRSENVSRPKLAIDASRISALADSIGADIAASVTAWQNDDSLVAAYAKLRATINLVGEAAAAAE
jgi:hypothetical protein